MNEISCDVCRDLIPLVQDGIASDDSREAVEAHIKICAECRALYAGAAPPNVDSKKAFSTMKKQIQIFSGGLMLIGLCFGLSLTDGGEMFYNSLLMPVVGMLGYGILGWKSLYKMPLLLAFTFVLINFLGMLRGTEYMDLLSVWMWTFIYSFFVLTGIAIAALLHYAFRRENHHEK